METAVGAACWLLGKVVTKLSDDLVAAYVASSKLGLNFQNIRRQLLHTQGLLYASQTRDVSNDHGLLGLLDELTKKADEAENMLDELHYFLIQDELDGTKEASKDLHGHHPLHGRHALRHTFGNCLPCFTTQDDDSALVAAANKLLFDRVAMSRKIKCVIVEMNSVCLPVSDLLKIANHGSIPLSTLKRPAMTSLVAQDKKLHGRSVIFEQTVDALTGSTYDGQTLSILPFFGPGGIGKTTFAQHIYNDERIKEHFSVRVWVCVSTDFDVTKLTREILTCIQATEKDTNATTNQTTNLDHLQTSIADKLESKRFLIVLDDIWKCNSEGDWLSLLVPFTKGEIKGNMVLVTTRIPSVAHMVKTTDPVELHGLEPGDFFTLFEACIFGHCKPEYYEDNLIEIAKRIATKLKGSPLAANTVGRLLKKNFSWEYWMEVLEKNEWQNTRNDDDIMPSLNISYYYLPFHLKKCFSYCGLFPEDHRFYNSEITSFWIAIGIIDSNYQYDNNYLDELVDNGFLIKLYDPRGEYYMMHDLMHELSRSVSSKNCININSLSFRADDVPKSIRHLSITVEDKDNETFGQEICKLKGIIDIKNLRTLMIFGSHGLSKRNILRNTFEETRSLRVLFIAMNTQECLPIFCSNLIHLRYLKLMSPGDDLSTLSRFYHLQFLDLQERRGIKNMCRNISRLVNLRYFYSSNKVHSNIPWVGKMKSLQELKEFHVKKQSVGFELMQLGELRELGGRLRICNLETVASKGEASDAKLKNKINLKQLELVWDRKHQPVLDGDVLEGLEPPPNLRVLHIRNSGAADVSPSWLSSDITMQRLEELHIEGVSWINLPPFEQLPHLTTLNLRNIGGMRVFGPGFGGLTETSFMHLKTIEIEDMPELEEWIWRPNINSSCVFPRLENIQCIDCPLLSSFSFLECCTKLRALDIHGCPKVVLPSLPHTCALRYIYVGNQDSISLTYDGKNMIVNEYNGGLAFQNMDTVEVLRITDSPHVSFSDSDLVKLNSLRSLNVVGWDRMFSAELAFDKLMHAAAAAGGSFQLEELVVDRMSGVLNAPFCSRIAATLHTLDLCKDIWVETLTEEQEQALHLLTSLRTLRFAQCNRLQSLPRGLYRLPCLRVLHIIYCSGIQLLPPVEDLPLASLQILKLQRCNDKICEQAKKLNETNPSLLVHVL